MVKEFAKIHSSENLSEEERRRREGKISLYSGVLERKCYVPGRKVIICIYFYIHMCVMDQCCIACYTVCSSFLSLSLPLSFWQCLIGTSCKRLRREREHLNAGKQSIVKSFCGVCVVKLCRWCCAVSSSISCPRQRWLC